MAISSRGEGGVGGGARGMSGGGGSVKPMSAGKKRAVKISNKALEYDTTRWSSKSKKFKEGIEGTSNKALSKDLKKITGPKLTPALKAKKLNQANNLVKKLAGAGFKVVPQRVAVKPTGGKKQATTVAGDLRKKLQSSNKKTERNIARKQANR